MAHPMSAASFRAHMAYFWLRDRVLAPATVLAPAGLKAGDKVLDYGCGGGSYALAAARLVGPGGYVYAADYSPLAVEEVRRRAGRAGLPNVDVRETACATGLADACIDVVLLYDVFQALADPAAVLAELHRVLKPDGSLSVRHHHIRLEDLKSTIDGSGLFRWVGTQRGTLTFRRCTIPAEGAAPICA